MPEEFSMRRMKELLSAGTGGSYVPNDSTPNPAGIAVTGGFLMAFNDTSGTWKRLRCTTDGRMTARFEPTP